MQKLGGQCLQGINHRTFGSILLVFNLQIQVKELWIVHLNTR